MRVDGIGVTDQEERNVEAKVKRCGIVSHWVRDCPEKTTFGLPSYNLGSSSINNRNSSSRNAKRNAQLQVETQV